MLESAIVYTGLVAMLAGLVAIARPIRFLRISSRRRGALVLAGGLAIAVAGAALPARLSVSEGNRRLDLFLPRYQFHEIHTTRVQAPPQRVFHAIKNVTAEEITLFRALTWLRSPRLPGQATPESILAPKPRQRIMEVALRSGFSLLAEKPERELVLGTIVCCGKPPRLGSPEEFRRLDSGSYAKAAINFYIEAEADGGSLLTTETRVFATDAAAGRKFAVYWRIIYPGSALIRRMWLAAIARRARAARK